MIVYERLYLAREEFRMETSSWVEESWKRQLLKESLNISRKVASIAG